MEVSAAPPRELQVTESEVAGKPADGPGVWDSYGIIVTRSAARVSRIAPWRSSTLETGDTLRVGATGRARPVQPALSPGYAQGVARDQHGLPSLIGIFLGVAWG